MHAVILAAGVGTRLGRPFPKSLSILPSGERILGRQVRILRQSGVERITIVVGFKMHLIMEEYPDVYYSYNPTYYITNTSKSLLHGIRHLDEDVLWLNGDVVFDDAIIEKLLKSSQGSCVCVDKKRCAEEEVKYRVNAEGHISELSKIVKDPLGEAIGINLVRRENLADLVAGLHACDDMDYFEKGIETSISKGTVWTPLDISAHRCIEVDFLEDWEQVQATFGVTD